MKGHVLGYDGTSGAITSEDGARFRFSVGDWREDRPPQARDQVDFVAQGETATEIYRVQGSPARNLPRADAMAEAVSGERVQAARGYLAPRPQLLLAAVLLFASVFLNFIEGSGDGENCCTKLTGVPSVYGALDKAVVAEAAPQRIGGLFGGPSAEEEMAESHRQARAQGAHHLLAVVGWASYALWLIPLGAAWIIYREIKNMRRRKLEVIVGVGAVASLATLPILKFVIGRVAASSSGMLGYALFRASEGTSLGSYTFGAIVIALCGLGLIGTGLGRISRTPGL